jgi:hypothetical protein
MNWCLFPVSVAETFLYYASVVIQTGCFLTDPLGDAKNKENLCVLTC